MAPTKRTSLIWREKVVILDKLKLLKHGTSRRSAAEQLDIIGFGCFHNTVGIERMNWTPPVWSSSRLYHPLWSGPRVDDITLKLTCSWFSPGRRRDWSRRWGWPSGCTAENRSSSRPWRRRGALGRTRPSWTWTASAAPARRWTSPPPPSGRSSAWTAPSRKTKQHSTTSAIYQKPPAEPQIEMVGSSSRIIGSVNVVDGCVLFPFFNIEFER